MREKEKKKGGGGKRICIKRNVKEKRKERRKEQARFDFFSSLTFQITDRKRSDLSRQSGEGTQQLPGHPFAEMISLSPLLLIR